MTATLTLRQLNRATLARQMLLTREKATPLHAIEQLVGLQAQWPRPPFIGLWSRLTRFAPEDLTDLLRRRQVVRATLMRCTLHLMSAKDYLSFRPALQPVLTRAMTSVLKDRLTGIDADRLVAAARAFFEKEPRTFTELREALAERFPKTDERAMGYIVRTQLPLVQVPNDTRWGFPADSDFATAADWLGRPLKPSASPGPLVLRYLEAFGPATLADVQAWSGLQGLKSTVEALRPKLRTFTDERGRELFDLPRAPRPTADAPAPVRFLPEFDNLIVSRADERFLDARHRKQVFLSGLRVVPTFLIDGFVAGTWQVKRAKTTATLTLEPFDKLPKKSRDAVHQEAEALLRFMEPDATTFTVA